MKKLLSVFLTMLFVLGMTCTAFAADGGLYKISNPYETVDWNTWETYKANLHTHTTYSDGRVRLDAAVEEYYRLGYDILAVSDHGVVGRAWNVAPEMLPILSYNQYIFNTSPLSDERFLEITTGADRGGRGMLCVTQAIELNAAVFMKNHVNGFFAEYGQGWIGIENEYERVIAGNAEAGGLSFINHPSTVMDEENYEYWIEHFTALYEKYPSCVGIEVINSRSRYFDVFDRLLENLIKSGRNIWGFASDDAHYLEAIGTGFELFLLPELSQAALRTAMENGTFFAVERRTLDEDGQEHFANNQTPYPSVVRVDVDAEQGKISLETENASRVEWVSGGRVIAKGEEIELDAHRDDITCYVRADIYGEGGTCHTQAFALDDGTPDEPTQPQKKAPLDALLEDIKWFFLRTKLGVLIKMIIDTIKK